NNWGQVQVISTDAFGDMYISAPSNWSTPYYPGSPGDPNAANEKVFLGAHTVTQDVNASSGSLNISSGGALNMLAGKSLSLEGDLTDDGTITINSNGSGSATVLSFGGGPLSGAGSVVLRTGSTFAQVNGTLTQGAGHTMRGLGQINAALTNNGVVNADSSGAMLAVNGATSNTGLMQASSGGTLQFASGMLSNLSGTTLTGGSYEVDAGSTISLPGSIATNAANIKLSGASTTFAALNALTSNT